MSATIPIAGDVAELIGPAAERVENRSLLLDKFVFHKSWPVVEAADRRGRSVVKWDEASRWSFIRIADGASAILTKEAAEKRRRARGRDTEAENRVRYEAEAEIAETLSNVRWDNRELAALRAAHTRRFLGMCLGRGEASAVVIGQLEGRLAINLADSLIQNAGISLDRLFGMPYIPGSAVKGVTRHAALAELKASTQDRKAEILRDFCHIFGTSEVDFKSGDLRDYASLGHTVGTDTKGAVSFLPAYPVNEAKVVVDLTNVHYPEYYRTGQTEDLSKESPRPNPFPTVDIGAQFAFCLVLNGMKDEPALITSARRWLESAITERGLGAKTASGYGWFSLQPTVLSEISAKEQEDRQATEQKRKESEAAAKAAAIEAEKEAKLTPLQKAAATIGKLPDEQFATFAKEIASKTEDEQRAFISAILENKDKKDRWKTWKKKKPELTGPILALAAKFNLSLQ
jgi:CRISPR-associated protein Cmr6